MCHQLGCDIFIECGGKSTLLGMGRACLPEATGTWLPSLRPEHSNWQQMLQSLGELYLSGISLDWAGIEQGKQSNKVSLPTYPFQRSRYWVNLKGETVPLSVVSEETAKTPPRNPQLTQTLAQTAADQRLTFLIEHLQREVSAILGLAPSQTPLPEQGFFQLGMDSLMAIELKNRLEFQLEKRLPKTVTFNYPSISALANYLIDQIFVEKLSTPGKQITSSDDLKTDRNSLASNQLTDDPHLANAIDQELIELEAMLEEAA